MITQNVDLYYLTGSMQTGYLVVPALGEAAFFVRRSVIRAQRESHAAVHALGALRDFGTQIHEAYPELAGLGQTNRKPVWAAEFDVLPVTQFQRLQSVLPEATWLDGSMLIRETRMLKSPDEVEHIREAAQAVDLALEHAIGQVQVGMPDYRLMSLIETKLREQGHLGFMRMRGYNQEIVTGMVGSGAAAAEPTYFDGPAGGQGLSSASPQSAGRKQVGLNEPILVDIGCSIDGYVIDQTRTLVIGHLDEEMKYAYEQAELILQAAEALLRPGTFCDELYFLALEQAKAAGLSEHFMGFGADQVRFLGHGIGLEIDELPVLAKGFHYPLEAGMVIAIEPKFTFPGRGVVGIEDSYLITEDGFSKLTCTRSGIIVIDRSCTEE